MIAPTAYPDRTGETIEPEHGVCNVDIITREINTGIYLVQDVLKSDPSMKGAPYFISSEGLEEMIEWFETGVWPSAL